jgi:hypothetical protein
VSDIPLYHGLMHDNTYKSLVEVEIPLHNVSVVGSCNILLLLYLVQNLLSLILHLCILLGLLSVHYTGVLDCTVWYCTKVVLHCIVVAWYYKVAKQYYTIVAQCCMEIKLG